MSAPPPVPSESKKYSITANMFGCLCVAVVMVVIFAAMWGVFLLLASILGQGGPIETLWKKITDQRLRNAIAGLILTGVFFLVSVLGRGRGIASLAPWCGAVTLAYGAYHFLRWLL
jgi:hypothetical protein